MDYILAGRDSHSDYPNLRGSHLFTKHFTYNFLAKANETELVMICGPDTFSNKRSERGVIQRTRTIWSLTNYRLYKSTTISRWFVIWRDLLWVKWWTLILCWLIQWPPPCRRRPTICSQIYIWFNWYRLNSPQRLEWWHLTRCSQLAIRRRWKT